MKEKEKSLEKTETGKRKLKMPETEEDHAQLRAGRRKMLAELQNSQV